MPALLKLDVIPAEAGTQDTSPQRHGPKARAWPRSADRKAPHLLGLVTWAPAFAGVTPGRAGTISQRHS